LTLDDTANFNLMSLENYDEKELLKDVAEMHIYSSDEKEKIDLKEYINQRVTVTGTAFRGHTRYHQREVMFGIMEIKLSSS